MHKGVVFDIKEFTVHDGPGIRTTVFMKGCPLHCLWCHNPEGMAIAPQLLITENGCTHCGKCRIPCHHPECAPFDRCTKVCPNGLIKIAGTTHDASELAGFLRSQADFFDSSGITISGGEPTMQPEFLLELLDGLSDIHTIVETCGHTSEEIFRAVAEKANMIYLDVKYLDSETHKRLTGVDNSKIQGNLDYLLQGDKPFLVRMPLIPGLNDDEENLIRLAERLKGSSTLEAVEFLPYNPFTGAKYKLARMNFSLSDVDGNNYHPVIPEEVFRESNVPFRVL